MMALSGVREFVTHIGGKLGFCDIGCYSRLLSLNEFMRTLLDAAFEVVLCPLEFAFGILSRSYVAGDCQLDILPIDRKTLDRNKCFDLSAITGTHDGFEIAQLPVGGHGCERAGVIFLVYPQTQLGGGLPECRLTRETKGFS